jgi:nucleotide-binding universal stress UspA family protein
MRAVNAQPEEVLAPLAFRHVLVPLDGSELAAAALPTAQALAAELGARVIGIAVAGTDREISTLRGDVTASVRDQLPADDVDVVVGSDPAEAVTRRAAELEQTLVCMSTRGRGRVVGALAGSVTVDVLQRCRRPVITVGPQADRPPALVGRHKRRPMHFPHPLEIRRIVACVDGSPHSETVLPVAAQWAAALDMTLTVLTVAEDVSSTASGAMQRRWGPPDPSAYVEELATRWRDVVAATTSAVELDPIGVASGLRAHLSREPAGLVALTTHARSGLDRMRLGSSAADIVRTVPVPALVVRASR